MKTSKKKKKPYDERTDEEKLKANWEKTLGLYKRKDYSAAIIRAATASEIAVNIFIRSKLVTEQGISENFVNHLLKWANGILGKFDRLIKFILKDDPRLAKIKSVRKKIEFVNDERNGIAHSGKFKNKKKATEVIKKANEIISKLAPHCKKYVSTRKLQSNNNLYIQRKDVIWTKARS